ncbi:MAG TPA: chemotaxis protein CheW [Polyangiaceae bacterium]|nr:chemotaxis protein CheW [Polyangiaceae bacterium]
MIGPGGASGARRLLICRVGSAVCGIPLEHVLETMRPLPVEPLAHMPGFVEGLALIRGRPTPVLDSRRLLGARPAAATPTRFVALRLGSRCAALSVDAVVGVRMVEASALAELPAILRDTEHEHVAALGALDAELLLVLEHSRILSEAAWLALEPELGAT